MEITGSIFDPRVVFEGFVDQLRRIAEQLNDLAVLNYLTHYKNIELNWRVAGVKFPHHDPDTEWVVRAEPERMEAHLVKGTNPVTKKLVDPWDAPRPTRPLPSSPFGPPVGSPDFPGAYFYVESTDPVQPGARRVGPDGKTYSLHVIPGIFGIPFKFWRPI